MYRHLIFAGLISFLPLGGLSATNVAQDTQKEEQDSSQTETARNQSSENDDSAKTEFNATLAKKLGADDYGMKTFVFVTLVTGKKVIKDAEENRKIFAGHFSNMTRLANEGQLVLAGPFIDGRPKRGMFILNVDSIKAAEKLVKTDPAIKAGVFDFELTKIYCSAALLKINELHKSIQKKKVN